jgi:uncharacterized oligopeptide transporter (OPT) family protein
VPAVYVATMFLGAVLDFVWTKTDPRSNAAFSIPVATGLIAGEALVGVLIPILIAIGLMSATH